MRGRRGGQTSKRDRGGKGRAKVYRSHQIRSQEPLKADLAHKARSGDEPYVLWCTGPSKTADVEGILIQGVHGPGEQVALIV
jgi:L-lactate utilization protein LutC